MGRTRRFVISREALYLTLRVYSDLLRSLPLVDERNPRAEQNFCLRRKARTSEGVRGVEIKKKVAAAAAAMTMTTQRQ